MSTRRYEIKAVRSAGGGHRVAEAFLRLPLGDIFEPWRSLVVIAAAAKGQSYYRPQHRTKPGTHGKPVQCIKPPSKRINKQLELQFEVPADETPDEMFYRLFPD